MATDAACPPCLLPALPAGAAVVACGSERRSGNACGGWPRSSTSPVPGKRTYYSRSSGACHLCAQTSSFLYTCCPSSSLPLAVDHFASALRLQLGFSGLDSDGSIHVGGLPPSLHNTIPNQGLSAGLHGCIKDVSLDGLGALSLLP